MPKSQGGKSTWENIVCCCVKCNVKKGGRTPEQAHMHLITKPVKPKRSPVINIRLADERYPELEAVPGHRVLDGGVEVRAVTRHLMAAVSMPHLLSPGSGPRNAATYPGRRTCPSIL